MVIKVANTAQKVSTKPLLTTAWINVNRNSSLRSTNFNVKPVPQRAETAKTSTPTAPHATPPPTTTSSKEKTYATPLAPPLLNNHAQLFQLQSQDPVPRSANSAPKTACPAQVKTSAHNALQKRKSKQGNVLMSVVRGIITLREIVRSARPAV